MYENGFFFLFFFFLHRDFLLFHYQGRQQAGLLYRGHDPQLATGQTLLDGKPSGQRLWVGHPEPGGLHSLPEPGFCSHLPGQMVLAMSWTLPVLKGRPVPCGAVWCSPCGEGPCPLESL